MFEDLGVAVVDAAPDQLSALGEATAGENPILVVEAERMVYALELGVLSQPPVAGPVPAEYLRGFRDAVDFLASAVAAPSPTNGSGTVTPSAVDESQATWGLQAVGWPTLGAAGTGVARGRARHGLRPRAPGLRGPRPVTRSFIAGRGRSRTATATARTASAPRRPAAPGRRRRATGSPTRREIFAGKVLAQRRPRRGRRDPGRHRLGDRAAAAPSSRCRSARRVARPGRTRRSSRRSPGARWRGHADRRRGRQREPAGPGVDRARSATRRTARRSWRWPRSTRSSRGARSPTAGSTPDGGQVDIAGPGVDVLLELADADALPARSAAPAWRRRTSPASPRCYAEANPDARGAALGRLLRQRAAADAAATDVGAGLVQAP